MMKIFLKIIAVISLLTGTIAETKAKVNAEEIDQVLNEWFAAWELVYKDIYGRENIRPVDFVLFDEKFQYSTGIAAPENSAPIPGADLMNLKLTWKKALHHGMLTFPDRSQVPVAMMCFAAENKDKAFFVMPLPSFWKKQAIDSGLLSLRHMVTGVFLHEFSHTQQVQNFGPRINKLEQQKNSATDFDDNYIQSLFSDHPDFVRKYKQEVELFYRATEKDSITDMRLINEGFRLLEDRQQYFPQDKHDWYKEVEELFLTMEGLGQYTAYLWLVHQEGAGLPRSKAINGLRRNKRIWSQDEGFAFFLIMERFSAPGEWAHKFFGTDVLFITELIRGKVNQDER